VIFLAPPGTARPGVRKQTSARPRRRLKRAAGCRSRAEDTLSPLAAMVGHAFQQLVQLRLRKRQRSQAVCPHLPRGHGSALGRGTLGCARLPAQAAGRRPGPRRGDGARPLRASPSPGLPASASWRPGATRRKRLLKSFTRMAWRAEKEASKAHASLERSSRRFS